MRGKRQEQILQQRAHRESNLQRVASLSWKVALLTALSWIASFHFSILYSIVVLNHVALFLGLKTNFLFKCTLQLDLNLVQNSRLALTSVLVRDGNGQGPLQVK